VTNMMSFRVAMPNTVDEADQPSRSATMAKHTGRDDDGNELH
jgi:hypothetical protein